MADPGSVPLVPLLTAVNDPRRPILLIATLAVI